MNIKVKKVVYCNADFSTESSSELIIPFFYAFECSDGSISTLKDFIEDADEMYGLTKLKYPDGTTVPMLTIEETGEPLNTILPGKELDIETAQEQQEILDEFEYINKNYAKFFDGRVWELDEDDFKADQESDDEDAIPTEEPVAEEPVAEEPVAEEPVAEEPVQEHVSIDLNTETINQSTAASEELLNALAEETHATESEDVTKDAIAEEEITPTTSGEVGSENSSVEDPAGQEDSKENIGQVLENPQATDDALVADFLNAVSAVSGVLEQKEDTEQPPFSKSMDEYASMSIEECIQEVKDSEEVDLKLRDDKVQDEDERPLLNASQRAYETVQSEDLAHAGQSDNNGDLSVEKQSESEEQEDIGIELSEIDPALAEQFKEEQSQENQDQEGSSEVISETEGSQTAPGGDSQEDIWLEVEDEGDTVENAGGKGLYAYKNMQLNEVTLEEVLETTQKFNAGESVYFIPRLMMREMPVVEGITDEDLIQLYVAVKSVEAVFEIPQEKILAIQEHLDNYDLRTFADTFELEDFLTMMHLEILDPSPTGLYEGLYKVLYLYKVCLDMKDMSEKMKAAMITIKFINLATSIQRAIAIEVASEDDDNEVDDDKETSIELISNMLNDTNNDLAEYLNQVIFDTEIFDEGTNRRLKGMEVAEYLCKLGETNKVLSLADSTFAKAANLGSLTLQILPKSVHIYSGSTELLPNAVGMLYRKYTDNIKEYSNEKGVDRVVETEIPMIRLEKDLDYNAALKEIKESPSFRALTNLSLFDYLSDVEEMNLQVIDILLPMVNGKVISRIFGFYCKNTNDIDTTRRYFIPSIGDFISQLASLQVTFTAPIPVVERVRNGKNVYSFKLDKQLMSKYGMLAESVPIVFDEDTTLKHIVSVLNKHGNLANARIPNFVKNSEESILEGYRYMNLYELTAAK